MPVAVQKYEPAAVVFPYVSISTRLLFFHSPPPLPHALAQAVLRLLSCRASGAFNSHLHPAAPPISTLLLCGVMGAAMRAAQKRIVNFNKESSQQPPSLGFLV
jgi:hypothetical protein